MSDMAFTATGLLVLIALATWGFIMWLILAPLVIASGRSARQVGAIARIQPDECWHMMEDR